VPLNFGLPPPAIIQPDKPALVRPDGSPLLAMPTMTVGTGRALKRNRKRKTAAIYAYEGKVKADNQNSATWDVTGVPIGTASPARWVLAAVAMFTNVAAPFTLNTSGNTIGGVAATILRQRAEPYNTAAFLIAPVPTGTSATVHLVWNSTVYNSVSVAAFSCLGLKNPTTLTDYNDAAATGSTTITFSLPSSVKGGLVFATVSQLWASGGTFTVPTPRMTSHLNTTDNYPGVAHAAAGGLADGAGYSPISYAGVTTGAARKVGISIALA
jgi:hypothetical protein